MISLTLCSVLLLAQFALGAAFDDQHHHVDPNEKLGTVSFPISCDRAVQKPFERGVALLHSFAYEEAGQLFQKIAEQDPRCAIAYWGQAMSLYHQLWNRPTKADRKRGQELLTKAKVIQAKTQRERDFIQALAIFYDDSAKPDHEKRAVAYAAAMKRLHESYPKDNEAAVFYALALLASGKDETEIANARQAIAILNKLFEQEPDHPGVAHYLIHACDNPNFAQQGLAAARTYAGIAPSAPHALHM